MNEEHPLGLLAGRFTLRWVAPPGWEPAPEGFRPDAVWRPDPYWPDSEPHWTYWRVDGPDDVLSAFASQPGQIEPARTWTAPPGWPSPREGFTPVEGWKPDPSWPPAPVGWNFWRITPQAQHAYAEVKVATRGLRLRELNSTEHLLSHHLNRFRRDLRVLPPPTSPPAPPKPLDRLAATIPSWRRRDPDVDGHQLKSQRLASLTEATVIVRDILASAISSDTAVPDVYYAWVTEVNDRYNAFDATHGPEAPVATHIASTVGDWDTIAPGHTAGFVSQWQAAEELAGTVLQRMGFSDAAVTTAGADGGVDVRGTGVVAQVKYTGTAIGRPVLQQLIGATRGARPVCFSRSGYTKQAYAYAQDSGIALFTLELPSNVTAKNPPAGHLVSLMTT